MMKFRPIRISLVVAMLIAVSQVVFVSMSPRCDPDAAALGSAGPIIDSNSVQEHYQGADEPRLLQRSNLTFWCIIAQTSMSRTSRRFHDHFPHAMENILPCWSYFRSVNAQHNCGFALLYGLALNQRHSWHRQLVDAMGCQVKHVRSTKVDRFRPFKTPEGAVFHTVNLKHKQPRYGMVRYLDSPPDAWALRRLFFTDEYIAAVKGPATLHIGMIQRTSDRVITNFDEILALLHDRMAQRKPKVVYKIHTTTLSNMPNISQQASWFATKDVIIGAHGAAMTNAVFICPGTIVLQIYPPNYFFQSLEPLIEQAGGIALDWYNGTDPIVDWRSNRDTQLWNRKANITPPAQEIVDLVFMGLGYMETPSGWYPKDPYLQKTLQTNWSKVLQWMGDV